MHYLIFIVHFSSYSILLLIKLIYITVLCKTFIFLDLKMLFFHKSCKTLSQIKPSSSATRTKILHVLFSTDFENRGTKLVPCQFLSQNSHGKSDNLSIAFRFCLSAITQFANGQERGKGLLNA